MATILAIAAAMMVFTTTAHSYGLLMVLAVVRKRLDRWPHLGQVHRIRLVTSLALWILLLSILEAAAWALIYVSLGALKDFESALYFSAVTLTTLGYGDVVIPHQWRLLSAFEAVNGIIITGLSTAAVVSIVQKVFLATDGSHRPRKGAAK